MALVEDFLASLSFGADWGVLIALELFLGGLGAGAYLISALVDLLGKEKWEKLSRLGAYASWLLVAAGLALLIIDLGRPELNRPDHLLNVFSNPSSMMTIGAALLMSFFVVGLATSALWLFKWRRGWLRMLVEVVGVVLALGVAMYTGLLLSLARGAPLWTSPFLPWVFSVSAVCTGIALVGLAETWLGKELFPRFSTGHPEVLGDLSRLLQAGIASELVALALYLVNVSGAREARVLLGGVLAPAFWGGAVALGLVLPLVVESYGGYYLERTGLRTVVSRDLLATISFILVLAGGIFLRYATLIAGQL